MKNSSKKKSQKKSGFFVLITTGGPWNLSSFLSFTPSLGRCTASLISIYWSIKTSSLSSHPLDHTHQLPGYSDYQINLIARSRDFPANLSLSDIAESTRLLPILSFLAVDISLPSPENVLKFPVHTHILLSCDHPSISEKSETINNPMPTVAFLCHGVSVLLFAS